MTLDEQLEILQAAKRGEKIEYGYQDSWYEVLDTNKEAFNFASYYYRIADPYAELKAAAKDPTKQIRCVNKSCSGNKWFDSPCRWAWCYPPEEYQIRDKPKVKKVVKYWCYERYGELRWVLWSEKQVNEHWYRRPDFDKECEVEDD
jgi:hypothetical protein